MRRRQWFKKWICKFGVQIGCPSSTITPSKAFNDPMPTARPFTIAKVSSCSEWSGRKMFVRGAITALFANRANFQSSIIIFLGPNFQFPAFQVLDFFRALLIVRQMPAETKNKAAKRLKMRVGEKKSMPNSFLLRYLESCPRPEWKSDRNLSPGSSRVQVPVIIKAEIVSHVVPRSSRDGSTNRWDVSPRLFGSKAPIFRSGIVLPSTAARLRSCLVTNSCSRINEAQF